MTQNAVNLAGALRDPDWLHVLLRYDAETGKLFWRPRTPEMFNNAKYARQWNTRLAGREAFAPLNAHGYACGKIFGTTYLAHRVIWAMETGAWPEAQIDHINGIRNDNRFANLREVTNAQNAQNQRLRSDNTSGVAGVYWDAAQAEWRARIKVNGKERHLGRFKSIDLAAAARKAAEEKYGFHRNHGIAVAAGMSGRHSPALAATLGLPSGSASRAGQARQQGARCWFAASAPERMHCPRVAIPLNPFGMVPESGTEPQTPQTGKVMFAGAIPDLLSASIPLTPAIVPGVF
jgi:hypothetical protein